jgi:hypothetical protein
MLEVFQTVVSALRVNDKTEVPCTGSGILLTCHLTLHEINEIILKGIV